MFNLKFESHTVDTGSTIRRLHIMPLVVLPKRGADDHFGAASTATDATPVDQLQVTRHFLQVQVRDRERDARYVEASTRVLRAVGRRGQWTR